LLFDRIFKGTIPANSFLAVIDLGGTGSALFAFGGFSHFLIRFLCHGWGVCASAGGGVVSFSAGSDDAGLLPCTRIYEAFACSGDHACTLLGVRLAWSADG